MLPITQKPLPLVHLFVVLNPLRTLHRQHLSQYPNPLRALLLSLPRPSGQIVHRTPHTTCSSSPGNATPPTFFRRPRNYRPISPEQIYR